MSESKWKVGETYKLRNGSEAVILGVHEGRLFGRIQYPGVTEWISSDWYADTGSWLRELGGGYDLMPPDAPRVTFTAWLNVYLDEGFLCAFGSRSAADNGLVNRSACICIAIDVPEGYGLDKDEPAILVRAG